MAIDYSRLPRAFAAALVLLSSLMLAPAAHADTFVVNATDDVSGGPCDVTHCNLREAMTAAQTGGPHTIAFDIPGSGVRIISLATPLPTVLTALTVDGFTQPGSSPNTNATGAINTVPLIELRSTTFSLDGLFIIDPASDATPVTIRGLAIDGLRTPIEVSGGTVTIEGCILGLEADGVSLGVAPGQSSGIEVNDGTALVGGTTPAARNVISGFPNGAGVAVLSPSVGGDPVVTVQGNLIGTTRSGDAAAPNRSGIASVGVHSASLTVGGSGAARNVISGNGQGIFLGALSSTFALTALIQNNLIGPTADGAGVLGNITVGIWVHAGPDVTIGGLAAGEGNVITGSDKGIIVNGNIVPGTTDHGPRILGNSIHGNREMGIDIDRDGVTPNDPGDVDVDRQNTVTIVDVFPRPNLGITNYEVRFETTPSTQFHLQTFVTPFDPSGVAQGQRLAQSMTLTTHPDGRLTVHAILSELIAEDDVVTSTLTPVAGGSTSEFSPVTADLALTASAAPAQALPHTPVTYRVNVRNLSEAYASGNANLRLVLPNGAALVTTTPGANVAGRQVSWTVGTLIREASAAYEVTVIYPRGGNYLIAAELTPVTPDPVTTNHSVTMQTAVEIQEYTITGDVRDAADGAVAGVTLTLEGGPLTAALTTTSDAFGHYVFAGVPSAVTPYTLTATKPAFTFAPPNQTFATLHADTTAAVFVATNGIFTQYFAEGATGFFHTAISLFNPSTAAATATVRYQRGDGVTASRAVPLAPMTQTTVDPANEAGFEAAEFSTMVESDAPVVASRAMTWAGDGVASGSGYGRHVESAVASSGRAWYLAEGATSADFHLYYLIQNSSEAAADVEITYLLPAPAAPIVKTYTVAPHSRRTILVNEESPLLAATDVSAIVRATTVIPIVVERAMYRTSHGVLYESGTAAAAVPAPSRTWFFAEGSTGSFFDLFLLLANPNAQAGDVEVKYLLPDGSSVTRSYPLAAHSRTTIYVNQEGPELASTAVAMQVIAPADLPIVAERAVWWPGSGAGWYEGHVSAGATAPGTLWAAAGGEAGGPLETRTYLLIANLSASPAPVRIRLTTEGGGTTETTVTLLPNSRTTLDASTLLGLPDDGPAHRFGVVVESLDTIGPAAPIVIESSVYSNSEGVFWRAGSNSVGTRLR